MLPNLSRLSIKNSSPTGTGRDGDMTDIVQWSIDLGPAKETLFQSQCGTSVTSVAIVVFRDSTFVPQQSIEMVRHTVHGPLVAALMKQDKGSESIGASNSSKSQFKLVNAFMWGREHFDGDPSESQREYQFIPKNNLAELMRHYHEKLPDDDAKADRRKRDIARKERLAAFLELVESSAKAHLQAKDLTPTLPSDGMRWWWYNVCNQGVLADVEEEDEENELLAQKAPPWSPLKIASRLRRQTAYFQWKISGLFYLTTGSEKTLSQHG